MKRVVSLSKGRGLKDLILWNQILSKLSLIIKFKKGGFYNERL
jgi:hypothetical protein